MHGGDREKQTLEEVAELLEQVLISVKQLPQVTDDDFSQKAIYLKEHLGDLVKYLSDIELLLDIKKGALVETFKRVWEADLSLLFNMGSPILAKKYFEKYSDQFSNLATLQFEQAIKSKSKVKETQENLSKDIDYWLVAALIDMKVCNKNKFKKAILDIRLVHHAEFKNIFFKDVTGKHLYQMSKQALDSIESIESYQVTL